jgi:hypothetical protein
MIDSFTPAFCHFPIARVFRWSGIVLGTKLSGRIPHARWRLCAPLLAVSLGWPMPRMQNVSVRLNWPPLRGWQPEDAWSVPRVDWRPALIEQLRRGGHNNAQWIVCSREVPVTLVWSPCALSPGTCGSPARMKRKSCQPHHERSRRSPGRETSGSRPPPASNAGSAKPPAP